jgi:hypothetical protein
VQHEEKEQKAKKLNQNQLNEESEVLTQNTTSKRKTTSVGS